MINGKTLKKSLSLLLTVLMVASLCAVCFGTFASAYTVNDTVFIDFENGKGVADSDGQAGSGIIADPADPDNMVYKFTSGAESGSYAWGPVKSADADAGQDNIYKLLPSTTYTVSFKYKFGAGYANKDGGTASVMLWRGTTAAASGKQPISTKEANLDVDATNGTSIEGTTYYALKEDSEWFTYSYTFTTPSSFLDGTVNKDRLFFFAQSHTVTGYSVNNPYYFDDVKITAKKATTETEAKTYVYDWRNDDGTAAYNTSDHNVVSMAGTPTNAGITEAMKNTSGLTSMGMIIGGCTDIPGTISPSSMPGSSSWVHKASIFDDASKSLGNPDTARGSVKLEAGTNYMVSVKYIPLTIFGGKTISFGVGGFDRVNSSFNTFNVKGNVMYTSAAYTQTTADDVADRDTFDDEGNAIKAAAENYIATYGWQEYTIAFTTSADYAPTNDVYLALNAATNGSEAYTVGKCWLAQFLVESVTVSVVDDEYVFVDKYVEGVKTTVVMKPGETLLPAGKNSLGEASIGWIDEDGAAIKTVPSKDATIYATYPSTVLNFESGNGVADYTCNGEPSGIVTDPDNANNKVVKIVSGAEGGAYNWIPTKSGGFGYSIDTATTAYELKANTRYKISLKYKLEAGSANAAIVIYLADTSDKSGKDDLQRFDFLANETNGTLIAGTTNNYALTARTGWIDLNYEFTTYADLGANKHICFVNTQHGISGYETKNIYYFDDVVIEEVTAANELYKTPVEEAKSSLRKKSATQSAGLRFRGELKGDLVTGADQVGFVGIVSSLIESDDWYKLEGADMTANKGKLASNAQYVKVENFKDVTGYYDYVEATGNYQYQLCFTGINSDSLKDTEFTVVMYVKTGDTFTYKYVNAISYNTVKQVYEANGIMGY